MAKCARCGKDIGGFFAVNEAEPALIQKLRAIGEDVKEPLCAACVQEYRVILKNSELSPEKLALENAIKDIIVCTISPYPYGEYEILGIASASVALGTGPLNQLASSISDFFGGQSESYNRKMQEAESACLKKLKRAAAEMGADAVVGLNTTYAELTQGHGMLLVCMNGTAIKRNM